MTPSSITPEQARERVSDAICLATREQNAGLCGDGFCGCFDRRAFEADAALAALGLTWADAAALMAGTKMLVPREPTGAMLESAIVEAGWKATAYIAPRESGVAVDGDISEEDAAWINQQCKQAMAGTWSAMLAAHEKENGNGNQ